MRTQLENVIQEVGKVIAGKREVIEKIVDYAYLTGFTVKGLTYSTIKGPEGNIEYLIYLLKEKEPEEEVAELSEHDAEEALSVIMKERTGLSHKEPWKKIIDDIVENSHTL